MRDDWAWKNKQFNKEKARSHTAEVYSRYNNETKIAIDNSKVYDHHDMSWAKEAPCGPLYFPEIEYKNTDTITAAKEAIADNEKVCILNFASYTHAGGMFINGSMAQEESICHATNLYNVLTSFNDYYNYNAMHKANGLYTDRAIYSKYILLTDYDVPSIYLPCIDVLTCSAPNLRYYHNIENNNELMHKLTMIYISRLGFIKQIFLNNDANTFILGAWGCGVFRNDPEIMKQMMILSFAPSHYPKHVKYVFAVPGNNTPQTRAFENIVQEYKDKWTMH